MRRLVSVPIVMAILFVGARSSAAPSFQIVSDRFLWTSANLVETHFQEKTPEKGKDEGPPLPLGLFSFQNHFERHGTPPPMEFLMPLNPGPSSFAEMKKDHILFKKTERKIPLHPGRMPEGATPAQPYLLPLPEMNRVAVVYPYYLFQDKEDRFVTKVYSDEGVLLSTYDSLPTHVLRDNPALLVSPERSGCCESFKWTIRFYHLRQNSVSSYGCPEGFCGDVLFTRLGPGGPLFIAQETVGKLSEIGVSLQTNLYVVGKEGDLLASGKILFALRQPHGEKRIAESLQPYSISNLLSVDPLPGGRSFVLRFGLEGNRAALRLDATYQGMTPCVVFARPKDPFFHKGGPDLRINETSMGTLPLLLILEPGEYIFSSSSGRKVDEKFLRWNIEADQVNIVTVE